MRIAATCERCGREFLLFQLYTASPFTADRCPHCSVHLGIVRVAPLAASADEALVALVRSLQEMAARNPGFRLDPQTVLEPVTEALEGISRRDTQAEIGSGRAA